MGGKCTQCGSTEELTFDCINPQGSDHHSAMDWSWRMSFYRAQFKQGNLQLLCHMCNSTKRDSRPF